MRYEESTSFVFHIHAIVTCQNDYSKKYTHSLHNYICVKTYVIHCSLYTIHDTVHCSLFS